jgi:hypothetical protein
MDIDFPEEWDDSIPMPLVFREDKATQLAARLLELAGGRLNVLPLVKMVYLADRTCLERYGRPVTWDTFYNMPNGPVVSSTMDCINAEAEQDAPYWSQFIGPRSGDSVMLVGPVVPDQLSRAEIEAVDQVFLEHRDKTVGEWIAFAHDLPEWENPAPKKRQLLRYRHLLASVGWRPDEITEAIHSLTAEATADLVLG